MRVSCSDKPRLLAPNSHLHLFETLVRLLKAALFFFALIIGLHEWLKNMLTLSPYYIRVNRKGSVYATAALHFTAAFKSHARAFLYSQIAQHRYYLINATVFPFYSSHSSPHRHTQWLHPAQVPTAAPTTVAAVTVAPQAGTSSAKPTSTSEACPRQPRTMTWSSSVSREYRSSSPHYLLLITYWFSWPRLSFLWHFCRNAASRLLVCM